MPVAEEVPRAEIWEGNQNYRSLQTESTREIEVFYMLFDIITFFSMTSLKQA